MSPVASPQEAAGRSDAWSQYQSAMLFLLRDALLRWRIGGAVDYQIVAVLATVLREDAESKHLVLFRAQRSDANLDTSLPVSH